MDRTSTHGIDNFLYMLMLVELCSIGYYIGIAFIVCFPSADKMYPLAKYVIVYLFGDWRKEVFKKHLKTNPQLYTFVVVYWVISCVCYASTYFIHCCIDARVKPYVYYSFETFLYDCKFL